MDDVRLVMPATDFSRRGFVVTSLAAGFALSVQPVQAQTMIVTDTNGLTAGEVMVPAADGQIPAYRAMPASGGPFPVVLVVQEIFGVHEHIKDVCRRLAKLGYLAIAPELYARQGDVSKLTEIAQIQQVVARVPDAQVMADLDATTRFARANQGHASKLGITGFCWGGRIVWLYAAHNPALTAGVAWYGRTVGDSSPNQPKHPIDVAAQIKTPILGLYGGADAGIPVPTVERMKAALPAGTPCEIVIYPDTPHAFHADYRPSYRETPAKDGWAKLQEWFKKYGVA
jgi:carboxymethylenebutenolidase